MKFFYLCILIYATILCVVTAEQTVFSVALSQDDGSRTHPLDDALAYGFCGVEVHVTFDGSDVLVDGHNQTIQDLYLDKLIARITQYKGIYPDEQGGKCTPFRIVVVGNMTKEMVDKMKIITSDAKYSPYLSEYSDSSVTSRIIDVILHVDGNDPITDADTTRHYGYSVTPAHVVSINTTTWSVNMISNAVKNTLAPLVTSELGTILELNDVRLLNGDPKRTRFIAEYSRIIHGNNQVVLFKSVPTEVLEVLCDAKIDIIGTKDLKGLKAWLSNNPCPAWLQPSPSMWDWIYTSAGIWAMLAVSLIIMLCGMSYFGCLTRKNNKFAWPGSGARTSSAGVFGFGTGRRHQNQGFTRMVDLHDVVDVEEALEEYSHNVKGSTQSSVLPRNEREFDLD